jgi:hypothetical protein
MTSATEIRTAWPTLNEKRKTALVMSLYPRTQSNPKLANTVVKLLDAAIGTQDVAEAVTPSQYAKLYHSTPLHSLDAILQSGYLAPTGNPAYLSLTRDSKLDYGSWAGSDSFVEFDIDQNAVRQRIKLEPYNHSATMGGPRATGGGESEERTKQKIPLKGFVTAMHVPTGWEGDKAGEHYGNLLKKYGVPIVYDIVPKLEEQGVAENFADGRNPQDKGDAKRHGINTKASVSSLRKTAKQGGRKGQLAHWLANMKSGRAKNEDVDSDYIEEKWSAKYKSSINCADPKGFSQKAHCAGRKK